MLDLKKFYSFFIFFGFFSVSAQRIEVCPSCRVSSVQKAIKEASPKDTIFIRKGVYKEGNILVNKPLVILGEDFPVLDGDFSAEIMTVKADSVQIKGIHFANVGESFTQDFAALRMVKTQSFTIENNKFTKAFYGIFVEKSKNGIIQNNSIEGDASLEYKSGNGIHLWYCKNMLIKNNQIFHSRDGIYFEFVDHSVIENNNSYDNLRYGLHFMFSNDNVYSHNTFRSNGAGVAVMFSRRIKMLHNHFLNNWGAASYGLLLKEIYDSELTGNRFYQNTIGIHIESTTRIDYQRNTFSENGWALRCPGGSFSNHFTENNFLNNTFDVAYSGGINDNFFKRNYWSQYTGYDLNHNGIGDVPYRPVKLFSYIVSKSPESMIMMRSLFVDILNFSEKVAPVFTPENLVDDAPLMKKINLDD